MPLYQSNKSKPPFAVTSELVILKLLVTIAGIISFGLLEAVSDELFSVKVPTTTIPSRVVPVAVTVLSVTVILLSVKIPRIPLDVASTLLLLVIFIFPAAKIAGKASWDVPVAVTVELSMEKSLTLQITFCSLPLEVVFTVLSAMVIPPSPHRA